MSIFYFPNPATLTFPSGGGGGGGAVDSVNGFTGVVVLDATDVGAANQSLSNLTNPTAMNVNLNFDTGTDGVVQTADQLGLAANAQNMIITAGNADPGFTPGDVYLKGSNSDGAAGTVYVRGGINTAGSGVGGDVILESGQGATRYGRVVLDAHGSKIAPKSNIEFDTTILASISTAPGSGGDPSQDFTLSTGSGGSTGNTGTLNIHTGNASSTNNSGSIVVSTGTVASGSRGTIALQDGTEGNIGYVWTQIDTDGNGHWMPGGGFPLLAPTSATIPQYSFADDDQTGFGQAAGSDIVVIIGATIRWVWGSTGYFPQQDNFSRFGALGQSVSENWSHFFGVEKAGVFRWYDSTNTNYIDFKAPSSVAAPISYTLPGVLATPGQILTDVAGDGVLSWITNSGGGASTALDNLTTTAINASLLFDTDQAYSIGSGTAAAAVIYSQSYYGPAGTSVQVGSQGGHLVLLADGGQYVSIQANGASGIVPLRMYDSDSSNYIAIQPASTIASNFTLTWPAAVPTTSAQAIVSTTGGVLSFFAGANGSFTTVDLKTVTVVNGLITTIV